MSQHLIDTGRHDAAVPDDDRSPSARPTSEAEHEEPQEGRGATASGGNGNGSHGHGGNGHGGNGHGEHAERRDEPATGHAGDATLRALHAFSAALAEMSKDERLLEERLKDLHRQRSEGRSWHEILGDEDPPGTMQLVSRILACLAKASGTLRKELVDSLRREGVSIPAIARLFGVTHQRVSNLLRRPSEVRRPSEERRPSE